MVIEKPLLINDIPSKIHEIEGTRQGEFYEKK